MVLIGSVVLTIFYCALIGYYFWGWLKIPTFSLPAKLKPQVKFSVLISVRNETKNIERCLQSLKSIQYPSNLVEFIVIDDHSSDNTAEIVEDWIKKQEQTNFRLISNLNNHAGKKSAITLGVNHASNEYIVLTDADCTHHSEWLITLNEFILGSKAQLIYAPVRFKTATTFDQIQALEFAGLAAIGGAAIALNNPNMCSAANLIFSKQAFKDVGGYEGNEHVISGDDGFLLHKIANKYPGEIFFLKCKTAMVETSASNSILELADQRKRWVSKSVKYENRMVPAILIGAYLFNLSIVVNIVMNPVLAIVQLVSKTTIESLFLWNVLQLFETRKQLKWIIFAEPLHILYVIIIGIWGNLGTYNWKGRNVKP